MKRAIMRTLAAGGLVVLLTASACPDNSLRQWVGYDSAARYTMQQWVGFQPDRFSYLRADSTQAFLTWFQTDSLMKDWLGFGHYSPAHSQDTLSLYQWTERVFIAICRLEQRAQVPPAERMCPGGPPPMPEGGSPPPPPWD